MNILNPEFKYTSSVATDIRRTFARVRREEKEGKRRKQMEAPNGKWRPRDFININI